MNLAKKFEHLKISLEAIKFATKNFADDSCIGRGGFGKVYKGELRHFKGKTIVAIKRLDPRFGQGNLEFWKEILMLSRYKHANLVYLLGFCDEDNEKILVYEYVSRKSLDLYLHNNDLTLIHRLNICIGAARGLAYLHNPGRTQQRLLHRDIKSSNILIDDNWNAKISDFGLSKLAPANQKDTFLLSQTVGTIGYCDPIYIETGLLTKESDVYSFGVVLFEVLCGRLCINNKNSIDQSLIGLVRQYHKKNKIREIIFDNIKDVIKPKTLEMFTTIAYRCLKRDLTKRPLMIDVVRILERAIEYQETYGIPNLESMDISKAFVYENMGPSSSPHGEEPASSLPKRYHNKVLQVPLQVGKLSTDTSKGGFKDSVNHLVDVVVGCASNLKAKIGEKLVFENGCHLRYVLYYNNYIQSLQKEVDNLKIKSEGIKLEAEEAIRNGEIIVPEVEHWFSSLDVVFEDSTRFLEYEVPKNKGILDGRFPNIKKRYIISKKAKKKTEKVATLRAETFHKISYPTPPLSVGDRSMGNFKNFESRIPTINKLMQLLKDGTREIISICGMGGSGKTTMVHEVARRVKGDKLFDEILLAVVSKEHDLMKVQENLGICLGLRFKTITLEGRANELWKRLLQSRKGNLVILDDVWKHIDLKNIGIPIGKEYNCCKVLLTSRSEDACKAIGCQDILRLDILTQSEAWNLLREMVGDSLHDPELHETALEVAKRCGGLPIAIVCLGRELKDKRKEVWNETLLKLERSIVPSNIEGMKEEVYQSLQVSYDLLGDEEAKKLFLLCCMYPEYANIQLEELVRCGIGLNFFQGVDLLIQARDRVYALTDKLKSRFLLLNGDRKSTVKVHNVVRALGISVASRLESNKGQFNAMVMHEDKWPRGKKYAHYNAVSVVSNELSELPSHGFNFQTLELLQLACPMLSTEKLNTMFERMEKVKVVELWNMSLLSLSTLLFSLPRDIIALCMDCKMENIGDIMTDKFWNLEILSFGNCDITELPIEIGKLRNLRLLDMSGCRCLEKISYGVISSLSQLEELDTGSKWWGDEEEGDASLTELESLTNLIYLGIRIKSSRFLPNNSVFERLQRYVVSVGVHLQKKRSFNNKMLLLKLKTTDTHLGGGINKLLRNNTEKVFLTGDGMKLALKELAPSGFQQVKNLTVESCNSEATEYLSDYSYTPNGACVFSNLEKLRMDKIWHLKGILRYDGKGLPDRSFSRLRKIHLSVLPEMTHLFSYSVATNLVHLERLHIEYCTNMQQVILNQRPSSLESSIENKIEFPKLMELILNDVARLICFSHGISLQLEFPQLRVLKLENLQNFHNFCPEEINFASKGNHRDTNFQSVLSHKVEFSSLAELTITNINNIKQVWCGHLPNLVHLQGLYIQFCHMMEEVILVQRPSITTMEERIVFLKLKEVILFGLNRLTFFCRGIDHVEFPQLRVLRLRWLTNFRNFCPEETTNHTCSLFNGKVSFPSLEILEVSELDSVEELWSNELPTSQFGKLKSLRVEKCHKLMNIFPSDLKTIFPSLEKLEVEKCDSLEQVWGSTGEQIRKMKSVLVQECPMLRNLCSFYTFKGLSNLQILNISSCKMMEEVVGDEHIVGNMKEVVSLNKLEEVNLAFLPNLNCFSSHNKCHMELEELIHVTIKSCPEMYTFSESSVATPKLKYVVVDDVQSWLGDLNGTMYKKTRGKETMVEKE